MQKLAVVPSFVVAIASCEQRSEAGLFEGVEHAPAVGGTE